MGQWEYALITRVSNSASSRSRKAALSVAISVGRSDTLLVLSASIFVFLVFLNRYVLGNLLRVLRRERFETQATAYEPRVTVIIPMYNEGKDVAETILSIIKQVYPPEKLKVIVVDDCSSDDSVEWACAAAGRAPERVTILKNQVNVGKRLGILGAIRRTSDEIIVSVDSDVVLEPTAIA